MRMLSVFGFGAIAAGALAGTAVAAAQPKTLSVPLPDGSVARIDYVGDVPPKVTVLPPRVADKRSWDSPLPSFAGLDRMIEEMSRRTSEMLRRAQQIARQPPGVGGAPYVASFGNLPAGETSTTVVSVSNGSQTCTRTTQIISEGPATPPKVTRSDSGQCAANPQGSGAVNGGA